MKRQRQDDSRPYLSIKVFFSIPIEVIGHILSHCENLMDMQRFSQMVVIEYTRRVIVHSDYLLAFWWSGFQDKRSSAYLTMLRQVFALKNADLFSACQQAVLYRASLYCAPRSNFTHLSVDGHKQEALRVLTDPCAPFKTFFCMPLCDSCQSQFAIFAYSFIGNCSGLRFNFCMACHEDLNGSLKTIHSNDEKEDRKFMWRINCQQSWPSLFSYRNLCITALVPHCESPKSISLGGEEEKIYLYRCPLLL